MSMQMNNDTASKHETTQFPTGATAHTALISVKQLFGASDFDIDAATSLIKKCPGGHSPKHSGISKGQSSARFSSDLCASCDLCPQCPSKKNADNYVVRINLKDIGTSPEHERAKSLRSSEVLKKAPKESDAAASAKTKAVAPGAFPALGAIKKAFEGKSFPIQTFKKPGFIASAAAVFLLIVISLSIILGRTTEASASSDSSAVLASTGALPVDGLSNADGMDLEKSAESDLLRLVYDSKYRSESESSTSTDFSNISSFALEIARTQKLNMTKATKPDTQKGAAMPVGEPPSDDTPAAESAPSVPPAAAASEENPAASTGSATVQEAAAALPAAQEELPYLIYVSKDSFTIAILGLDENGEHTELLRTFNTAIGRTSGQTRAGTYTITGRERWRTWSGPVYTPYTTGHSGGLFFHGPIFTAKDPFSLRTNSYNEIGTSATSGCLRTYTSAAAWIYYNCANGTKVIIANDSKYTSAAIERLESSQNYDPTDPDAQVETPEEDLEAALEDVEDVLGDFAEEADLDTQDELVEDSAEPASEDIS